MDFANMTRKFLLGEWNSKVSTTSRIASIKEALQSLKPRTNKEKQRVELALENLTHIRREHRKLKEQVHILEEKLQILEEGKEEN
tara:strand:- start:290 stop:544 length:255 start_codon:yes stop_codon:yes gene_type:complete